jgi:hypothetical protein
MILIQDNIGMNYLKDNIDKSNNSYVTLNLISIDHYFSNVRSVLCQHPLSLLTYSKALAYDVLWHRISPIPYIGQLFILHQQLI